jgi:hypothetical protein
MNIVFICDSLSVRNEETNYFLKLIAGLEQDDKINTNIIAGEIIDLELLSQLKIKSVVNENFLHSKRSFRSFFKAMTFLRDFCSQNKINIIHSGSYYSANISYNTSYTVDIITIQTIFNLFTNTGNLRQFRAHKYITVNNNIYEHTLKNKLAEHKNLILLNLDSEDMVNIHIRFYKSALLI